MARESLCIICLDSDPPPIQSGCACRSDTGLAYVGCLVEKALAQRAHRGARVWWECQTCEQMFTGPMRTGLAGWWALVGDEVDSSDDRLAAACNLAQARSGDGRHAEAERLNREVLRVRKQVLGYGHPETMASAGNLELSLSNQGKHAEAERINREVLRARRSGRPGRSGGPGRPGRPGRPGSSATSTRNTLSSANNLAVSLSGQGKHAEAVLLMRDVLCEQMRVLGEERPDTLTSGGNLAVSLSRQGDHVEAEEMCHAALASRIRVLGVSHPDTLRTARNLEFIRTSMTARPEVRGKHKTQTAAEADARGAG
jgi:hypothetical protein